MYTKPEVIEIGEAAEVILTFKSEEGIDDGLPTLPDGDLDD
jgi:hypothetical protein